jgi:ABC-type sugar transport system ATPase subunit
VTVAEREPLLRASGLRKQYPGVLALAEVNFDLIAGEVHAVVGENGSGKSTLLKILSGSLRPDAGTIRMRGREVEFPSPAVARANGIAAITQELTLAPTLSVTENVFLGRLPRRGSFVDWKRAHADAHALLDEFGVDVHERSCVGDLRIEQRQQVEIVRAMSSRARILILDEATSSLSEHAAQQLLERIEQLRHAGVAVVFVSHRLREVFVCAQRATVLRDGHVVGTWLVKEASEDELVRSMVGRTITDLYGKNAIPPGRVRLTVENLSTEDALVRGVSFEVRAGEITGVAGLVGSGKSELGLALAGAVRATGRILIDGEPARLRSPRDAVGASIAYVPEDRKSNGLLLMRTLKHNLSLPWARRIARYGLINRSRENELAREAAERFRIRAPSLHTRVEHLSGGNQQKIMLARWFALGPSVIVLGEPTRGIDVATKSEVYRLVQQIAAGGAAVLMISSEMLELLGLCDRILVMYRGQIRATFDATTATEEKVAAAAVGAGEEREAI